MSQPSYRETFPEGIDLIRWPHKHPLPEEEVLNFFTARNIQPTRWSNGPGYIYNVHSHAYRKTLFCTSGSITFSLPDLNQSIMLHAGDRLILPAGIRHGATVGPHGVTCIEAGGE